MPPFEGAAGRLGGQTGHSDEQLQLIIDFTREGRELQERHAEWLGERLNAQSERTSAP